MATGTIVEVLEGAEALRPHIAAWEALAEDAAEPNPFFEHWMLLPALEAYGEGENFRCVAVWQDGRLGGLFPMRLERRYRGLPLAALRTWQHRNMLVGTPLVRRKDAAKCVEALLESGVAPLIELEWTSAGGAFYGALVEAAEAAGLPWTVTDGYARAVLVRDRDPRERFTSNLKNNLRRSEARLAKAGKITPVRLQPGDDLEKWLQGFLRLEASGWKGEAGSALQCRKDDRRFIDAIFPEAFRRGRLLITGLDLDGRPLARHCMLAGGEGAFTFKIAYDEVHASASPGLLAEADNVRQFMEQPGPRWLDSNTARENKSYGRVWKDRRTFLRIAVGTHGAGRVAAAALPLLRLAKRWLRRRAQHGTEGGGANEVRTHTSIPVVSRGVSRSPD